MNKVYCPGGDCPLKENCSRFKVIQPKENHFPKPPFKDKECEFFVKIDPLLTNTNSCDPD